MDNYDGYNPFPPDDACIALIKPLLMIKTDNDAHNASIGHQPCRRLPAKEIQWNDADEW